MEQRDIELINKYKDSDHALAELYREHVDFEQQLDALNNKSYLTPHEEVMRKQLQKKKLLGRDRMEAILMRYRKLDQQ